MKDIFISYQWDMQGEVKALCDLLEDVGFMCWMDIHEMGGGDWLYATIESGMRDCKVVLACVTCEFLQSRNCW